MAGTTVHRRLNWYAATVVERREETRTARTLVLEIPGWPGHAAGQHVDVRLRAADGYTAIRTYSIASAPNGERLELTIELMPDGEVSPYLVETIAPGDPLDVLGPIGGWFVWKPDQVEPVQLIAGGSGIVPLMAMLRTRQRAGVHPPFHLLYSVRNAEAIYYAEELRRFASGADGVAVSYAYTRTAPPNWPSPAGRVDAALLEATAFPSSENALVYVCGPTAFVEAIAALLTRTGYDATRIKTERFGPTGS
jgi:ferredoxin-NADP reductase